MAVSKTTLKYIAIAAGVVLLAMFVVSLFWDAIRLVLGLLVALGLIWLGMRFLRGKGLPQGVEKAARKVIDVGKSAADEGSGNGK